jgi:hypothetical protein
MAMTAAGCTASHLGLGTSKTRSGSILGPIALGVNVAAWDSIYTDANAATINDLVRAADLRLLRYPGGSWADEYDWTTNTDSSKCTGSTTTACTASDALGFNAFSTQARAAGASTFVTVNYGSGSPADAADWVAHATSTKTHAVALWEVGNEGYSCYEKNKHLEGSPTFVKGYAPNGPVCPATTVMAKSYAANAAPFIDAMKKASPHVRIGVPWALSGDEAKGSGVTDATSWNSTVLHAVGGEISFVDVHWYPFDTTTGITDQQILTSIRGIPSAAARIRSSLHHYAPDGTFVVGETNISERLTTLDFQPVSALFAAATSLEWLLHGAESVDWWDLNNFGSPSTGDYGLVSSGSPETEPAGTPFPPYYGEELASRLTTTGSHLETVATGSSTLLGFESDLRNLRRVLLINADSRNPATISPSWFKSGSNLQVEAYRATTASSPSPIARSTARSDSQVSLPALSIVVLSGTPRP